MLRLEEQYFRLYGEPELHLIEAACRPGRDALDIGANEGAYALFLRKHAREVHVFEPVPWVAERLRRKFGGSVVVHELALSAECGTANLHIPLIAGALATPLASLAVTPSNRGKPGREIVVRTAALDDVYSGEAGFIKIDVEGHEETVLHGASRTIARGRPNILVEIEERHAPGGLKRVVSLFAQWDYCGYFLHRAQMRPVEEFEPETMQNPDTLGTVSYIANFVFLPREQAAETLERLGRAIARLPDAKKRRGSKPAARQGSSHGAGFCPTQAAPEIARPAR